MDAFLLYVKNNYRALILSCIIIAFICGYDQKLLLLAVIAFNIISGYNNYKKDIDFETRLKAKGLTREDAANIQFVKEWETTRQKGVWNYAISDGGIICGAGLSVLTSIVSMFIMQKSITALFAEPADMFRFIGLNYLAGAALGITLFRFRWNVNEKRFFSLTDPLNQHFSTVKELL
ncbi:hypothetical protein [Mucilaginibacter auburnensis]|uniref:Uncharacterized protein n=1 Tax=Mucilaginibacter auburnensis TaxID=1457233 RepID=A0A2H9VMR9_9SPHI|nr:hypothetical protein [Mucilaginibacter auburnensis]PJJ79616.1 hypothetical protein CLV57_2750 [Mucilaginibacter auburnensis]